MPQTAKKDVSAQRLQEKESKSARGALSCAECRRLKLKCDKTVPCSSCKQRGCSAICPNGSLITGQGTRFVLADTEKLHTKIATMSDRIRDLENALAILQSSVTTEPHPLLDRELLKVKSAIELHSAVEGEEDGGTMNRGKVDDGTVDEYVDAFGTLAIHEDGATTFYGSSAGPESLLLVIAPLYFGFCYSLVTSQAEPSAAPSPVVSPTRAPGVAVDPLVWKQYPGYAPSPSATFTTSSFPFSGGVPAGIDLRYLAGRLPLYAEAVRLCELYLEQAPWFFAAITRDQLTDEILPLWYSSEVSRLPPKFGNPTPQGTAHDLALLYMIFCFGAFGDTSLPFPTLHGSAQEQDDLPEATGLRDAEYFYRCTKVALALEPVLEGPPSVATVQTLALLATFEGLCGGENSVESTWAILGLSTKLAQSIGLHRDCARWGLKAPEVQKRRALFWELFVTDCWQALATGRLPTFSLAFVDCELPQDVDQTLADDGTPQSSFPYWKARFGAECVSAVVQGTLTSRAPKYSIILELDRKVRDMEFPKYATGDPPEGLGLSQTMSHFMPINYRHMTLLYIHRCFFAHAISNYPHDPIKSPYAPSFLAGYRSACELLASLRLQFNAFPGEIARFWVLWTHAFSSAIMLCSVVTHATRSKVAPAALLELGRACELFETAAKACPNSRASKFVPILNRLSKKAVQAFEDARNGAPPMIPNNIFQPSRSDSSNDEFSIFSGRKHTLTTKAKNTRPAQQKISSDSPHQVLADNPSFAGVHPSLVDELHGFEGHINAQIQKEYYFGQEQHRDQEYRPQQQQGFWHQSLSEYSYRYPSPHQTYNTYSLPHGITAPSPISLRQVYDAPRTNQRQAYPTPPYQAPTDSRLPWSHGSSHIGGHEVDYAMEVSPSNSLDQHMYHTNLQLGQHHTEHYTPDGALRGIAAEDPRLQEHWQAYMSKVGSPRMLQDVSLEALVKSENVSPEPFVKSDVSAEPFVKSEDVSPRRSVKVEGVSPTRPFVKLEDVSPEPLEQAHSNPQSFPKMEEAEPSVNDHPISTFVVFMPSSVVNDPTAIRPNDASLLERCVPDGGNSCEIYRSADAENWVEQHYNVPLLESIRSAGFGGPIATMLSPETPALAIFGSILDNHVLDLAQSLCEASSFAVMVRPSADDPVAMFLRQSERMPGTQVHGDDVSDHQSVSDSDQSEGHDEDPPKDTVFRLRGGAARGERHLQPVDDSDYIVPAGIKRPDYGAHRVEVNLRLHLKDDIVYDVDISPRTTFKFQTLEADIPQTLSAPFTAPFTRPQIMAGVDLRVDVRPAEVRLDRSYSNIGFIVQEPNSITGREYLPCGFERPTTRATHTTQKSSQSSRAVSIGFADGKPTVIGTASLSRTVGDTEQMADETAAPLCYVKEQIGKR
ncbi:fungal-specific transcription factor domain-containing protein [Roridomyces roridus]|uniref:Fungal-specific transcription factor domain-containing protein n=1 Tax=Roridomyces roridus TaxID=1738132 RepID=A0AAD7BRQ0_9AGAR|nr:fungal-specific transcription factor domain-containing protein [Roridomyces roridus]